jgi:hypothetical protein
MVSQWIYNSFIFISDSLFVYFNSPSHTREILIESGLNESEIETLISSKSVYCNDNKSKL